MSSLSVLCPTIDPGPRVRAMLEPLRAVADEIVVAADSRADPGDVAHYAAVADRVVRYERGPAHSGLSWLHEQCRGDWVLVMAGDEVASPALLAALPELVRSRDAVQVQLPLRWLWPGSGSWLTSFPWHPDFQPRLVRNDGTLRFRGVKHELARWVEPLRIADDLPVWHLSLLLADADARRAKARRNQAEQPGLVLADGRELNDAYYVPEDAGDAVTAPVGAADREAIEAVLHAERPPALAVELPVVPFATVARSWARRDVSPGAFSASLELLGGRVPGAVFVKVRNLGDEVWPRGLDDEPPFRLGFRTSAGDEGRVGFPHAVRPGDSVVVRVELAGPAEIGVVLEHVRWFGDLIQAD